MGVWELKENVVDEKVVKAGRFTLVSLCVGKVWGHGISRKSDSDKYSNDKGYDIAKGRALKSAYNKMKKKKCQEVFID